MIATLLVSGSAPPTPSIWRGSGDPITANSTRSRDGNRRQIDARKKGPFEVPPRISVHAMAVCEAGMGAGALSGTRDPGP